VRHIPAAPALVAAIVAGVVAGAGVCNFDDHAAASADIVAVKLSPKSIFDGVTGASHFIAVPTATTAIARVGVSKSSHIPASAFVWPQVAIATACK
jgi:hypothetical protein